MSNIKWKYYLQCRSSKKKRREVFARPFPSLSERWREAYVSMVSIRWWKIISFPCGLALLSNFVIVWNDNGNLWRTIVWVSSQFRLVLLVQYHHFKTIANRCLYKFFFLKWKNMCNSLFLKQRDSIKRSNSQNGMFSPVLPISMRKKKKRKKGEKCMIVRRGHVEKKTSKRVN